MTSTMPVRVLVRSQPSQDEDKVVYRSIPPHVARACTGTCTWKHLPPCSSRRGGRTCAGTGINTGRERAAMEESASLDAKLPVHMHCARYCIPVVHIGIHMSVALQYVTLPRRGVATHEDMVLWTAILVVVCGGWTIAWCTR